MKTRFDINGVTVEARFDDQSVREVLVPLLRRILREAESVTGRMLVLLAAPPAAGKSTLNACLEQLAREMSPRSVQALGLDGFHRHQEEIARSHVLRGGKVIPMARVKGAPESFDVQKLKNTLTALKNGEDLRFPVYDRRIHDVVEDALEVTGEVILLEGNWLLLDEAEWRDLPGDFTIFVDAPEPLLKSRVIDRRLRTGRSLAEAETLYEECDGPNIRLCMGKHIAPDVHLVMTGDGQYRKYGED